MELHLEGLTRALPEEGLEVNVDMEIGGEVCGPGEGCLGVGLNGGEIRPNRQRDWLALAEDGHKAMPLELHVEEAAGDGGREALHHGDLVGDRGLEGKQIAAVDNEGVAGESEKNHATVLAGQIELRALPRLAGGLDELGALPRERLLHSMFEAVLQHPFSNELHVPPAGHHAAQLHPNERHGLPVAACSAHVHLQEALALHRLESSGRRAHQRLRLGGLFKESLQGLGHWLL